MRRSIKHQLSLTLKIVLMGFLFLLGSFKCNAQRQLSLSGDVRLNKLVTIEKIGIELGDFLASVGNTSLSLSSESNCTHLKLQLRLRYRPLHRVMEALAELVPGKWIAQPNGTGYILAMDADAVSYRKKWWELLSRDRERALEAQEAHILASMRKDEPQVSETNRTEPSDRGSEAAVRITRNWYRSLPKRLQEAIASRTPEIAFDRSEGPFFANPYPREGAVAVSMRELPSESQSMVLAHVPKANQNSQVFFSNTGFSVKPMIQFDDGSRTGLDMGLDVGPAPGIEALGLDHRALPKLLMRYGKSAPPIWKELVEFQNHTVWKNDPPETQPRRYPPPRRSEILSWICARADIDVISDYYSRLGVSLKPEEWNRKTIVSLSKELDLRAAEQDQSWKKRTDGILIVRNNRWYRDDLLEVDNRTLERLRSASPISLEVKSEQNQLETKSKSDLIRPFLDWKAKIARSMTPVQLANGLMHFHSEIVPPNPQTLPQAPFRLIAEQMLSEYRSLLFFGNLNEIQKSRALRGQLPFLALTSAQQREALWICPELNNLDVAKAALSIGLESPLGFLILGDVSYPPGIPFAQLTITAASTH